MVFQRENNRISKKERKKTKDNLIITSRPGRRFLKADQNWELL